MKGWSVVGNGDVETANVDVHGFFAYDVRFGRDEYDESCDIAALGPPCDYSCEYSDSYPRYHVDGSSDGVLELDGSGVLVTDAPMLDFPKQELTLSFWIKAQKGCNGTIFSYQVEDNQGFHEVALHNPSNLFFLIRGIYTEKRKHGFETGLNVADGTWHFLSVSWRSAGGQAYVYIDGVLAMSDTMVSAGVELKSGGIVVIGQSQSAAPCKDVCPLEPNMAFVGNIQNVKVWDHVRLNSLVSSDMIWPFTAYQGGLIATGGSPRQRCFIQTAVWPPLIILQCWECQWHYRAHQDALLWMVSQRTTRIFPASCIAIYFTLLLQTNLMWVFLARTGADWSLR